MHAAIRHTRCLTCSPPLPPTHSGASHVAGHGGVVKVGDMGMSRYAAQWRSQGEGGGLERTLTPGERWQLGGLSTGS